MVQPQMKIGWAQGNITPQQPVLLRGLFHARISEGVMDPLTATAWALESENEQVILVSCDLIFISDELRDAVRSYVAERLPDFNKMQIILNATHTHTGPELNRSFDMDLGAMDILQYVDFAARRIADTAAEAWNSRQFGSVAYGLGQVVAGSNRRWVDDQGAAHMRGVLRGDKIDTFRHIEGYEDHSMNLAATYNSEGELTGLIINVSSTAQFSESLFVISADWWHETRILLREKYGNDIFILPQCSAAGEITPFYYEKDANNRMMRLKGRTAREEFARRIVRAIEEVVPYIAKEADSAPVLKHQVDLLDVPANKLTEEHVESAKRDADYWKKEYEQELKKLEENPQLRKEQRWYIGLTNAYRRMNWNLRVVKRFESQSEKPVLPAEFHVLRLGDIAFATVPYELYLDFGIQMKVRSKAMQTFVVQLAGPGTYLPSPRSVQGGGYGSIPASNPVGPEGGQFVVEHVVKTISQMFSDAD